MKLLAVDASGQVARRHYNRKGIRAVYTVDYGDAFATLLPMMMKFLHDRDRLSHSLM